MCVLASMMLDRTIRGEIASVIDRDVFFQADHQILFDVILAMDADGIDVDAVLLRGELAKRQLLEEIGGTAYIGEILSSVPSAAHGIHYANQVKEKAMVRQLIAASNDILRDAYAPHENARTLIDKAEQRIFKIAENRDKSEAVSVASVMVEVYADIENQATRGLETGFYELDDILNGLQAGEMIVVAARPSMGKTAFAISLLEHPAAAFKTPTMMFSLEMSKQQIAQRLLCMKAGIDSHKVRKGMLSAVEYAQLAQCVNDAQALPFFVEDGIGLTPLELRAKARRAKQKHDIGLIIIDYLQLMECPGPDSRQQQITEISRGIKATARELNVPVVALSQLNRNAESREGHRPRMSDLRESGSIEQDADVVLLLHREDYYRRDEPDFIPDNIGEVIVAKQRNGPIGSVKLAWNPKATVYQNLSTVTDPF